MYRCFDTLFSPTSYDPLTTWGNGSRTRVRDRWDLNDQYPTVSPPAGPASAAPNSPAGSPPLSATVVRKNAAVRAVLLRIDPAQTALF
jgi:hypothetical protein